MAVADELGYLFRHHAWATIGLIDFCRELPAAMAAASAPGTYGAILPTLGHLVGADEFYAFLATGIGPDEPLSPEQPYGFDDVRRHAEAASERWAGLFQGPVALDRRVEFPVSNYRREATLGVVLAQALTHGGLHRAEVGVVLGHHGIETPDLTAWAFGRSRGELEFR